MRKYYIDNLRWILILLLVPYHAAQAFNVWGEPNYIFLGGDKIISSVIVFLSPYFMPLMFLIAGVSTSYALKKRTVGQYISERAKKLLIPLALGTVLLMPPMVYLADKFNCGYSGGFFRHYAVFFTRFTDLTGADGGFSFGQFWFILYLFVISLIATGVISLQKRIKTLKMPMPSLVLILFLGLPLPFLAQWLSIGGKSFAEYLYLFLLGYYVFSDDSVIGKIEKHKWFFLCAGLTATVSNVYLFIWSDVSVYLNAVVKYLSEWLMIIALLGIGKGYLNFSGKFSKHMSQGSYTFYIFHFIWVVLFQYLLFNLCSGSRFLMYLLPIIAAYTATALCCELYHKVLDFHLKTVNGQE